MAVRGSTASAPSCLDCRCCMVISICHQGPPCFLQSIAQIPCATRRFNFYTKSVDIGFYPLRPEFIESTYHLYQATKDPFYLHVGEMVIHDLNNRTRLPCGFATLGDVRTGHVEDRMESFMLSETLKYLYLLFDTGKLMAYITRHCSCFLAAHPINSLDSNFVFTTGKDLR